MKEMSNLHTLSNVSRPKKRRKLVGRGPGSGRGKTSCRGFKGAGSRSGWKARYGTEGGPVPLFRKIPVRGFTRGRFIKLINEVNLDTIEELYSDGETVNEKSLREKGYLKGPVSGVKVLGNGTLTKKVKLDVQAISKKAEEKLKAAKILK